MESIDNGRNIVLIFIHDVISVKNCRNIKARDALPSLICLGRRRIVMLMESFRH